MTSKSCFVIMPYGGNDTEKQEYYLAVYNNIIKPAAEQAGYTSVWRSDLNGASGSITRDIVDSLSKADIVIADLSEGNPNVLYEVGVRHVFRKSGTVHIVNKKHMINFDLSQYHAVEYSTDGKSFAEIQKQNSQAISLIIKDIQKREQSTNVSDNPVHDFSPGLPVDLMMTGDDALRKQMKDLEEQLTIFRSENENLSARLSNVDPNWRSIDNTQSIDIDNTLTEAARRQANAGRTAVIRLINASNTSNDETKRLEAFITELASILKSPYLSLSASEFQQIAKICAEFGLSEYRVAVLEIAQAYYPTNTSILLDLAVQYADSANPSLRLKGRSIAERFLGVTFADNLPVLSGTPFGHINNAVGLLFNIYFEENRYQWIVALADALESKLGPSVIFVRNKAKAFQRMRMSTDADKEFRRAIALDATDAQSYQFYADFLDDEHKYEESYEFYEQAICADPEEEDFYINLANHIMLRGVVRDQSNQFVQLQSQQEKGRRALPLYFRAVQVDPMIRNTVANILVAQRFFDEARSLANGIIPESLDYDFAPLSYIQKQLQSL